MRHPFGCGIPELRYRPLVADEHTSAPARGGVRKAPAAGSRRNDVRTDVTERRQPVSVGERGETSKPAPRDVLEKDALHRLASAELQDLLEARLDRIACSHRRHEG